MSNTMYVFPGQGSQQPGMAAEFMNHPLTAPLFEEANDILGFDLASLMRDGEKAELTQTENAQPALFLASVAALKYYLEHAGVSVADEATFVAGHSLGEYSALYAAGVIDFATGVKLTRARGEAMAKPLEVGRGAMAAIIADIPLFQIESIANNAGCWVANDNSPEQTVISGSEAAIDKASNIAVMENIRKVMRLNVSAPFHTPLMQEASFELEDALAEVKFAEPSVPVISNVTASPIKTGSKWQELLVEQVVHRVRWRESMEYAAENGVTRVLELGTGKVLTNLAKRCDERLVATALGNPVAIDTFLEEAAAAA